MAASARSPITRWWAINPSTPLTAAAGAALQLEVVAHQWLDRLRDHHRPGRGQTRHPRGQVRGKPVHVVLGGIQIHQPAMHPHPHCDLNPEPALGLLTEQGHLTGDLQPRQHGAADIVLMRSRIPEHRQQPVALRRPDMALEAVHYPRTCLR